ncbi:MAG: hypothetical protein V3S29_00070 [bacterium]
MGLLLAAGGWAQAAGGGSINGRIIGAQAGQTIAGATVVLLKIRLGDDGKPQGGPVARQKAGPDGGYSFALAEIDPKAVYRVGTRVGGRLVSSSPFTFPAGKSEITADLVIPRTVRGFAGLEVEQAMFVLEPRAGAVMVTEVLHVRNPTGALLDSSEQPLRLPLHPEAEDLELVSPDAGDARHERLGGDVLVFARFQPGPSTIAFRYRLSAALGTVALEKKYPLPVREMMVVAPKGSLSVSGDALRTLPGQKFGEEPYDAWGRGSLEAGIPFSFRASGVPVRQVLFLLPLLGFFAVTGGVVWWFLSRRLAAAHPGR